jgi:hypothetical protein
MVIGLVLAFGPALSAALGRLTKPKPSSAVA